MLSNDFEGEEKGSSSDEDQTDYDKVEAAENAENNRLKQKLARELLTEQETEKGEQLFTQKDSKLLSTSNTIKIKSKRKIVLSRDSTNDKRKVRLNQAFR